MATQKLTVPQGGSGAATLTGMLRGNGTAPFTAIADGTNGQALTTNGAGVYSFATVSGSAALTSTEIGYGNTSNVLTGDALFIRQLSGTDYFGIALQDNATTHNLFIGLPGGAGFTAGKTGLTTANTYNIAIGAGAGDALTSATKDLFMGHNAGGAATTGHDNIAIGDAALSSLTTGNYNTVLGSQAMITGFSAANNNVAIGYAAMGNSGTSGSSNVAVGLQALYSTTSGSNNIGVGENAMSNLTTASNNVGIGQQALDGITSGDDNTALGNQAGNTISTGVRNVMLGKFSDASNNARNDSIALGYNAQTTQNNQMTVGSNTSIISSYYFGSGVRAAAATAGSDITFNASGAGITNSDLAGGSFIIAAGIATGSAIGGDFGIQTSVPHGSDSTLQNLGDRQRVLSKYTTLTETTDTAFASITVATSGTVVGGVITYTVEANDGTDFQALTGTAPFSIVNKAGTLTLVLGTDTQSVASSSIATLAGTLTLVSSGTTAQFKMNATSTLTQTVLRINAQIIKNFGVGVIAAI